MASGSLVLGEAIVNDVPFGRRRIVALLGGGLAALSMKLFVPEAADANHQPTGAPCSGFGACHCCNVTNCCQAGCYWNNTHSHCPSGTQCWTGCLPGGLYRCCDWHVGNDFTHCICRAQVAIGC